MSSLRAGRLRSRITLQSKTGTPDGQGGSTFEWLPAMTVWAELATTSATGDALEADQSVSRRAYTITIRRNDAVTSAMRVVRGVQVLEILAVLVDDTTPDATVLSCREVPA